MDQRNVAFEAEYEVRVTDITEGGVRRESRELFRLYRDARGRSRLEGATVDKGRVVLRYALLTDLRRHRALLLDLATGKPVDPCHAPAGGAPPAAGLPLVGRPSAVEVGDASEEGSKVNDLGETQIEGLEARGLRVSTPSSTTEVWTARQIDQPPLLVRTMGPTRESTARLFNVRLIEPDPRLFSALDDR